MKTSLILVGSVILFFILGLLVNYVEINYTKQQISSFFEIIAIGLPIIAFGLMVWSVLFGPYDGPPYF